MGKVELIGNVLLLAFIVVVISLALIDRWTSWLPKWFCDHLDWHKTPSVVHFDGCSTNGVCPRCNRRVLEDSNGDYFAAGRQDDENLRKN